MASEQFSLCWDNFHKNMSTGMNSLLENEDLVDVTLAVQGKLLKAHKMVLSVCSPYFKELFKSNPCQHPIVFMKDVSYEALSDLLQFMYQGEVQVSQENLSTFIKTAEALQIKGLTGDGNGSADSEVTDVEPAKHTPQVESLEYKAAPRPKKQLPPSQPMTSPSIKRPRLSIPAAESTSVPQSIAKTEPSNASQSVPPKPESVHFKMEPYDSSMSLIDESGDDNFGEDALDETGGDETEDYSMMESGAGEEPQAGTSTDGAGEGQGLTKESLTKLHRQVFKNALVIDGFSYHQHRPKNSKTRYLSCGDYKRLACKARAVISLEGATHKFVLRTKHNHPPLHGLSLKDEILKQIKVAILTFPSEAPRDIYRYIFEIVISYLGCAEHKKAGCRGRATIPLGGWITELKLTQPHNHPPDLNAEEKEAFSKELKSAVRSESMANATLKKVYETVATIYPKAAADIPFKSISSSLHRWRRNPLM